MNTDIANIIKSYTDTLPFRDRSAGLVRTITIDNPTDSNQLFKKSFPVACNVTQAQCMSGKYDSLVPDSKVKSISYFEDGGLTPGLDDHRDFSFESRLRQVWWFNLKKLGKTDCNISALAIANVLNVVPTRPLNSSPYTRIQIRQAGEIIKDKSIFSKYTYEEEKSQYLMYPFDYFAIEWVVKFCIPKSCIQEWTNSSEICETH